MTEDEAAQPYPLDDNGIAQVQMTIDLVTNLASLLPVEVSRLRALATGGDEVDAWLAEIKTAMALFDHSTEYLVSTADHLEEFSERLAETLTLHLTEA